MRRRDRLRAARPLAFAFATTALAFLTANPAAAAQKTVRPTGPSAPTKTLAPGSDSTSTPLSATECVRLGGTLQSYSVCNSNVACTFVDQHKHFHAVCVTSLFHD